MKKFHFPLETLLKVRSQEVKIASCDLSKQEIKLKEAKEKEGELLNEVDLANAEMVKKRAQGDFLSQVEYDRYLTILMKNTSQLKKAKESEEELRHLKQKVVVDALQAKKMIEKLKEKKYSKWHQASKEP